MTDLTPFVSPIPRFADPGEELVGWLTEALAETLDAEPHTIRPDVPLWEYGVDSLVATSLLAEIDDELGVWVDPGDVPPGISLRELAEIVVATMELEEDSDVA